MTTTKTDTPTPAVEVDGIDAPLPDIGPDEAARYYQKGRESVFNVVSEFLDTMAREVRDPRLEQLRERLAITIGVVPRSHAPPPRSDAWYNCAVEGCCVGDCPNCRYVASLQQRLGAAGKSAPAPNAAAAADPLASMHEALDALRADFDDHARQLAIGHDFAMRAAPLLLLEPEAAEAWYDRGGVGPGYLTCAVNARADTHTGPITAHISMSLDDTDAVYLSVEALHAAERSAVAPERMATRWSFEETIPRGDLITLARVLAQAVARARDTGIVED